MSSRWSAPVRYAEVDQQGVVFNSHYLLYCDEAMAHLCRHLGLPDLAERVRLATTTLTWTGPARWGDVIEIDVRCQRVGRTSLTVHFDLRVSGRACCTVDTVYVLTDTGGAPLGIDDATRAALELDER